MVMCSGYPVLQAAAGSTYFIARGGRFKYILRLHAAAAGLTAFWLLPLLWRLPWNTPYSFSWYFLSWREIAPPLLWPSIAGTLLLALTRVYDHSRSGKKFPALLRESLDSPELYLFWQFTAAMVGFSLASSLGLADGRFLPFARIALVLLGAVGWGELLSRLPKPRLCLAGFCAAAVLVALTSATFIDGWITWNYSGMQSKPLWNSFRKVNDNLRGDENSPRVAWEHNDLTNQAGTVRAFEMLPWFSGRSSLAGLYMQSASSAPFVYYLQSELSETPSCPFEQYYYSRPDPARAAARLRLFNASRVVAVSENMADALSLSPDYELSMAFPPFAIFRVKGGKASYVEPLRFMPLRIPPKNWKNVQFDWFRKSSLKVPLVVASKNSPGDFWKELKPYDGRPGHIPALSIPGSEDVRAKAVLDHGKITIDTSRPGFPLWVKVSYHPDWKITAGAGELYPASPAFMLLVPKTSRVVLTFDTRGGIYLLGRIIFFLTVLVLAIKPILARLPRVRPPRLTGATAEWVESRAARDNPPRNPELNLPSNPLCGTNGRFILSFALMATVVATTVLTRNYRDPVLLYQLAAARFDQFEGGGALASTEAPQLLHLFDTCMAKFDHSVVFDNCESYKARLLGGRKMWSDLRPMLERYLEENPDTRMHAQALYWLGEASLHTGRPDDARRFFREALFFLASGRGSETGGLVARKNHRRPAAYRNRQRTLFLGQIS